MTYVHGHDFRAGLRLIRATTDRPFGMNALIEKSSKAYADRVAQWIDVALDEGVRFFITSLGNPRWVVDQVAAAGALVYHDVTDRRWAAKAIDGGVHGLIGVNSLAGGHPGRLAPEQLLEAVGDFGVPVICAGGVGDPATFRAMLNLGYDGVQMGTRFIATSECRASREYKQAIVEANPSDIVLTERLTGIPVAVIRNDYIGRLGTRANPIARLMLRHRRTKYLMRRIYHLLSRRRLKHSSLTAKGAREYWQAGKSVAGIASVMLAGDAVRAFAAAIRPPG
jgi:nitronate monooxygenase